MKRLAALPFCAILFASSPALAVAVSGGEKPVMVHEDYVLLHHDETAKRVHVLYAARLAPAFRRIAMGIPTPTTPTIESVVVDLPAVLHALVTPTSMRMTKRGPVPPAPWIPDGAKLDTFIESATTTADHVFDAAWTKSHLDKGYFIAGMGVTTPEDGRIEVVSVIAKGSARHGMLGALAVALLAALWIARGGMQW